MSESPPLQGRSGGLLVRPTRKSSAHLLVRSDGEAEALYGNVGNWAWVEDRPLLRACVPCRAIYPPSTAGPHCPRHGETSLIPAVEFRISSQPSLVGARGSQP